MTTPVPADLQAKTIQQFANVKASELLGVKENVARVRGIVDMAVAGATNDATLRFNSANDDVTGDAISVDHDATDGDSFVINEPGLYAIMFSFSQEVNTEVMLGVSYQVAAAGLNSDPTMATAGMLDYSDQVVPLVNSLYHKLFGLFYVSQADIDAGTARARCHGTNASDAVIPDATILDNTECHAVCVQLSRGAS